MSILALLLLCLGCSALFSGLETGLVTANRVRLRVQAGRGDVRARLILRHLDRPQQMLATILVGNTVCNILAGALATAWATAQLDETWGPFVATGAMTLTLLVLSELTPKAYFRVRGETAVPRFLWFLTATSWLFRPLVWAISLVFRATGGESGRSAFVTREELRQLVREGSARLGAGERRLLENVFDFGRTTCREVMIPLPRIVSLPDSATPAEVLETVRRTGYTRIPVYRERVDRITGVVNVFDMLYDRAPRAAVGDYLRPLEVVPETKRIDAAMVDLQRRREAMALVVNEFGAVVGVVTLADIVEEIMGELADEHGGMSEPIQKAGEGWILDGATDIDDLNAELGLALEKDQFETVAGLVLKHAGRIPRPGERIRAGGVEFEVLTVHPYGIRRVRMRKLAEGGERHDAR